MSRMSSFAFPGRGRRAVSSGGETGRRVLNSALIPLSLRCHSRVRKDVGHGKALTFVVGRTLRAFQKGGSCHRAGLHTGL